MSNHLRLALASALIIATGAATAATPSARILHHENLSIASRKQGTTQRLSFEAFGRQFEIVLEKNQRVAQAMSADGEDSEIQPYQGTVERLPGSWVRLTRGENGRWQGMLSDGQSLYAIEPTGDVREMAVEPLSRKNSTSVMYRLEDLDTGLGPQFCETEKPGGETTGLDLFKSIVGDVPVRAQAAGASRQLAISVVADYEFTSYYSTAYTSPREAIVSRMNIVDGIFSEQLGVTITVPTITTFMDNDDPFTKSDSKQLLNEVRTFRKTHSQHASRGLTHLMTGRQLNGDTVGVAYLGTVCGGEYAVSLSEAKRPTTVSALITAHEMGHNFNAPHDGDSEGACANEAPFFLMAPSYNGSDRFSACSVQQITPTLASGKCLTAFSPADSTLQIPNATVQATVDTAASVSFSVMAGGSSASREVSTTITVPSAITINSSSAVGGACSTGAGSITCTFGTMEAGTSREVSLQLVAQSAATYSVDLEVASSNDNVVTNNTGHIKLVVSDAVATPQPVPQTSPASGGGGGGGSTSLDVLGFLALLCAMKAWAYRRVVRNSVSTRT